MERGNILLTIVWICLILSIIFMTYKYIFFKIEPSNYELFSALLLAILTRKNQD